MTAPIHTIAVVCAAGFVLWLTFMFGKVEGRHEVMTSTVVRVGSPYYSGVYFGECAQIGSVASACATLPRDK